MPSFGIRISVKQRGVIFNAAESSALRRRLIANVNSDMADSAVRRIRQQLRRVVRQWTGNYAAHVITDRRHTTTMVWDQNIIYGDWLEGTSPRNRRTRFKGYQTFAIVRARLDKDSLQVTRRSVDRYIKDMNR